MFGCCNCAAQHTRNNSFYSFVGKSKTKENRQSIINPDWNFEKMGIGGLDKEFSDIFRRAFASRVFPPEIVEQMGECDALRSRWRNVAVASGSA
ncbi:hypothetical protein AV530_002771 [Patagioenas fasciata monilis]|uniref:Vesicle-fusing ATPase n=1 Tax=Patagioenas fasciata monilis TaxID=372326 RepID=A0A1V4JEK7_PATFA|nr:hypothetical protein AV530_002771 [Patagioenas fasciata monilis]